ncbi:uncharacterized protein [Paramormyrops kingsleyae]|uniref:uncharacterized protein isoform X2 n=1 Tax=Paramormyrops kingsleyae TaxID=1676925 RepID=UPI003B970D63
MFPLMLNQRGLTERGCRIYFTCVCKMRTHARWALELRRRGVESLFSKQDTQSYIYDPSVSVDIPRRKSESCISTQYQQKSIVVDSSHKVQGFHNLGYSSGNSEAFERDPDKLQIDNNEINRLHTSPAPLEPGLVGGQNLYILQVGNNLQNCTVPNTAKASPSVPSECSAGAERSLQGDAWTGLPSGEWLEGLAHVDRTESYASMASLSTVETRVSHLETEDATVLPELDTKGGGDAQENGGDSEDRGSVLDSDVAEALAALEAAMAGEDCD